MSPEIVYRPIQPDECHRMVALHHTVFSADQVAHTIYASPHVDRYLANLVAFPQLQREHVFWGVWDGEALVGYAHFRALSESYHLNYTAVLPTYQGCGIGRMLWARFIEMGRQQGYNQVSLTVEHDNQRAMDWYQRQGLRVMETVWRYEKNIDGAVVPPHEAETVRLLDWEQSEAWQLAYEFSQFRLVHQERVWTIERLGKHYFRVRQLLPAVLEGTLSEIDPTRRLLILSSEPIQGANLEEVGASFRMQSKLA